MDKVFSFSFCMLLIRCIRLRREEASNSFSCQVALLQLVWFSIPLLPLYILLEMRYAIIVSTSSSHDHRFNNNLILDMDVSRWWINLSSHPLLLEWWICHWFWAQRAESSISYRHWTALPLQTSIISDAWTGLVSAECLQPSLWFHRGAKCNWYSYWKWNHCISDCSTCYCRWGKCLASSDPQAHSRVFNAVPVFQCATLEIAGNGPGDEASKYCMCIQVYLPGNFCEWFNLKHSNVHLLQENVRICQFSVEVVNSNLLLVYSNGSNNTCLLSKGDIGLTANARYDKIFTLNYCSGKRWQVFFL